MTELVAHSLGKRFGSRIVFRRLELTAPGGRTLAITGANGSGKSTLVRILAGVMRPSRGTVDLTVDGQAVPAALRPFQSGLVAPYMNLYDRFSPRENLRFIGRARSMSQVSERVSQVLELVGLAPRADDLVSTFSSGMKQRLRIAAALMPKPDVLLLDEPTSNLDELGKSAVLRIIDQSASAGRIVIVATNDSDEAARCDDRISVMDFQASSNGSV